MNFKRLLIACTVVLALNSCKKDNSKPAPPATGSLLINKWYTSKIITRTYSSSGTELDSTNTASFTSDDFVIYYSDGSGYYSQATPSGTSINEFSYKLSGTLITEYTNVETAGLPETITSLSQHNFSLHVVTLVPDADDPDATDTEIADYYYYR